jgi:exoribonuclease II
MENPLGAVERDAAAPHDHVDVRVTGERRAPGMADRQDADSLRPRCLEKSGWIDARETWEIEEVSPVICSSFPC